MPEIRLRDVEPSFINALEKIAKDYNEKTNTGTLMKLVESYPYMKDRIAVQAQEIKELKAILATYKQKEGLLQKAVENYIENLEQQTRYSKQLLKQFGTKKRSSTR